MAEDAIFKNKEPWRQLKEDRVGVKTLTTRLKEILTETVRQEIPNVKSDIPMKLNGCRKELQGLGPNRATKQQQHDYLFELATTFQRTMSLALEAHYGADDIFDDLPSLKLATTVLGHNSVFNDDVWKKGHAMTFDHGGPKDNAKETDEALDDPNGDKKSLSSVRYKENRAEMDDILPDDRKILSPDRRAPFPGLRQSTVLLVASKWGLMTHHFCQSSGKTSRPNGMTSLSDT